MLAGGALAQGEHEHHDAAASDPHAGHAVQPAAQPMRAWYGQYAPRANRRERAGSPRPRRMKVSMPGSANGTP